MLARNEPRARDFDNIRYHAFIFEDACSCAVRGVTDHLLDLIEDAKSVPLEASLSIRVEHAEERCRLLNYAFVVLCFLLVVVIDLLLMRIQFARI